MDIPTLCEQFCSDALRFRGYSPTTIKRYRDVIHLFRAATGVAEIVQCDEILVREFFYRGRAERNWTANTFRTYHKSLLVFFRWCVKRGHLASNPAARLELPKVRRSLPQRLSEQEADRLLELIRNHPCASALETSRDLALVATMVHAGLRRMELLRLHVSDVDLQEHALIVRLGKGGKDRFVPLTLPLADILRRYLAERRSAGKTCPEVFTSLRQDRGLTIEGLRRVIAKLRRITGTHLRPHMFRHTFATLMLEGGCDVFSLSQMMGHSDIKTTTLYLAASVQHLRAQIAKHPLNHRQM